MPDQRYYFYKPHPGRSGCLKRIPEAVREAAQGICLLKLTREQALAVIQDAAGAGYSVTWHDRPSDLLREMGNPEWDSQYIGLSHGVVLVNTGHQEYTLPEHNWRVVFCRPANDLPTSGRRRGLAPVSRSNHESVD